MKKKPLPAPTPLPAADRPASPELAMKAHEGTPAYGDYGQPAAADAPPAPDYRAAGGNVYDLSHEQTEL
ncbi:hypothetical protein GKZ68_00495 [Hymenobacter sp. BRD128]|uniref:hypothetical protein n=1 Tax=Hymenobacter sp. BRD128 TaxID=2675878 RepID=UPI0015640374|nr:hypothetical protein [Hymenobacter sp. BRD128]QKG55246.1 hypothetical protein GKZ68_00495 [Hymenobacter sp. BRD128]